MLETSNHALECRAQRWRWAGLMLKSNTEHVAASEIEELESEQADGEAALPSYEILTYPADYVLEVLVKKFREDDISIPKFQRGFVWNRNQASRLIDSFLKGLPVPSIFLFSEPGTEKLLVVDGQQRLRSIVYFFEGYFGEETRGRRMTFRLTGLEEGSPYEGKTYEDIRDQHPAEYAKLNNSVLRSFVMRQLSPDDDTSIYHVFERLNTGGTQLCPQEIRNCVHHGEFNDLLQSLNDYPAWREVYGRSSPDPRQRDVELILRFFALFEAGDAYVKPMKHFLNQFMRKSAGFGTDKLSMFRSLFEETTDAVLGSLGEKPFHIRAGLNAAVFDSVYVAVARNTKSLSSQGKRRFEQLISDEEYLQHVSSGTTDVATVAQRLRIASTALGDAT